MSSTGSANEAIRISPEKLPTSICKPRDHKSFKMFTSFTSVVMVEARVISMRHYCVKVYSESEAMTMRDMFCHSVSLFRCNARIVLYPRNIIPSGSTIVTAAILSNELYVDRLVS